MGKQQSSQGSKRVTEARAAAQRTKLDHQAEERRRLTSKAPKMQKKKEKENEQNLLVHRRATRTIEGAIGDFLGDHEGGNSSPKTLQWYANTLGLFRTFLEKERAITLLGEIDAIVDLTRKNGD